MSTFTLKIKLGNEAMQSRAHVAEAIRCVAVGMRSDQTWDGAITDSNGNTVGFFELDGIEPAKLRARAEELREGCWDIAADEYEAGSLKLADLPQRVRGDGAALSMIAQWAVEDGEDFDIYPDGGIPGEAETDDDEEGCPKCKGGNNDPHATLCGGCGRDLSRP